MIKVKTSEEIALMRISGKINFDTHELIKSLIKPGITTKKLDQEAASFIKANQAKASFKGFQGYPASICTSVNDEVVHGLPTDYVLKTGDVVSVDIGVEYNGYHTDSARTYIVGVVDKDIENLITVTEESLHQGIKVIKEGAYLSDISNAIAAHANKHKLGIVRELVGHGVGAELHEEPSIPNYHRSSKGPKLKAGMTLAIEPMLNLGSAEVIITDDWPVVTKDGKPSAHFEHTVLVTKDGYEILTENKKLEAK